MLIALALQQILPPGNALQGRSGFLSWEDFVGRHVRAPAWRLLVVLITVGFAGAWLFETLEGWVFGLPLLLLTAATLLWSLGSDDYHTALERYDARRDEDSAAALACLDALWMPGARPEAEAVEEGAQADETARRHLLYAGYARWFPPLLYFALAGPVAALLYRCVALIAAERGEAPALRVLEVLDWLPSRLVVLSFAVTGDFLSVVEALRSGHRWRTAPTPELFSAAAGAAGARAAGPRGGADLLYRSSGLWLLVFSGIFLLL